MKKINITSIILVIYVTVMAVIGWPGKEPEPDYVQYFSLLGISVVVIIALRLVQIRRMKMRENWRKEREETLNQRKEEG